MGRKPGSALGGNSLALAPRAALATTLLFATVTACTKTAGEHGPASDTVATPLGSAAPAVSAPPAPTAASSTQPLADHVKVTTEVQDSCRKVCDRSKQLKCKQAEECLANCYGMASLTPCSKEINALFPCLLREPLEHWECGDDGMGAIRPGYCDREQGEAVTCMEQKMKP